MNKKLNSAILFSGGKDSTLALHYALKESGVKCLIIMISENKFLFRCLLCLHIFPSTEQNLLKCPECNSRDVEKVRQVINKEVNNSTKKSNWCSVSGGCETCDK